MVVRKQLLNQQQASYHEYLRRWKATGEGLPHSCCKAHRGVERAPFVHFDDFLRHEHRLIENEFFMAGLRQQGKTRGGAMPSLIKQQRDLRAILLIEEEAAAEEITAGGNVTETRVDMQGPTGTQAKNDDDGMVTV